MVTSFGKPVNSWPRIIPRAGESYSPYRAPYTRADTVNQEKSPSHPLLWWSHLYLLEMVNNVLQRVGQGNSAPLTLLHPENLQVA